MSLRIRPIACATHGQGFNAKLGTPVTDFCVLLHTSPWLERPALHWVNLSDSYRVDKNSVLSCLVLVQGALEVFRLLSTHGQPQKFALIRPGKNKHVSVLLYLTSRQTRVTRKFQRQGSKPITKSHNSNIQKLSADARAVTGYTTLACYATLEGRSEPSRHGLGPSSKFSSMAYRPLLRLMCCRDLTLGLANDD